MPSTYVDRGIIKWAPFDALVGYGSMIRELKIRLGKQDKPLLSDDQCEELNRKLHLACQQDIEVSISYYHDGYIRTTMGSIKKIDWVGQWIILMPFEKIKATDITDIYF
ncbi:MAG TPA: YolD-like family protein [Acholeplasmataceae bacterium]|nr:YolD-like family protein [Acholeplasmataceae bacterium]